MFKESRPRKTSDFGVLPISGDNVYYGDLSENFEIQYPWMNWGELSFIVIGTTMLLIVEWKHIHMVLHLYIRNGDYIFTIHISIITLEADQLWYSQKSGLYNRSTEVQIWFDKSYGQTAMGERMIALYLKQRNKTIWDYADENR